MYLTNWPSNTPVSSTLKVCQGLNLFGTVLQFLSCTLANPLGFTEDRHRPERTPNGANSRLTALVKLRLVSVVVVRMVLAPVTATVEVSDPACATGTKSSALSVA